MVIGPLIAGDRRINNNMDLQFSCSFSANCWTFSLTTAIGKFEASWGEDGRHLSMTFTVNGVDFVFGVARKLLELLIQT